MIHQMLKLRLECSIRCSSCSKHDAPSCSCDLVPGRPPHMQALPSMHEQCDKGSRASRLCCMQCSSSSSMVYSPYGPAFSSSSKSSRKHRVIMGFVLCKCPDHLGRTWSPCPLRPLWVREQLPVTWTLLAASNRATFGLTASDAETTNESLQHLPASSMYSTESCANYYSVVRAEAFGLRGAASSSRG